MRTRRTRFLISILCAAVVAAVWYLIPGRSDSPRLGSSNRTETTGPDPVEPEAPRRSPFVAPNRQISADRPALVALPPPPETERSHLADKLHAPNQTGVEDLSIVLNLFTHYRVRFQGFPVGEDNATFMNALTGNNPGRLAFISRDHPAIDAQGQLLDRWGEPFFFHLLGRDALEIRSAGPDHELYTGDDLLLASPEVRNAQQSIADR